jgi:hypothetical protein
MVLHLVGLFGLIPAFFSLQKLREDARVGVDDAVGEEARAFAPDLLLNVRSHPHPTGVGIGDLRLAPPQAPAAAHHQKLTFRGFSQKYPT